MTLLLPLLLACTDGGGGGGDDGATDDTGTTPTFDGGTDGGTETDGGATDGGTEPPPPPELTLDVSGTVLDPLRSEGVQILAQVDDNGVDVLATVEVLSTAGTVLQTLADRVELTPDGTDADLSSLELSWDARDEGGAAMDVATYTIRVTIVDEWGIEQDSEEASLHVVRAGLLSGTWGGDEEDERVALLWHKATGASSYWDDGAEELAFSLESTTTGEGETEMATEVPAVWEDLETPPEGWDGANLPQGFRYDATPTLTLTLGAELGDAAEALTWNAAIEGWELTAGSVAEGTLTFTMSDKLSTALGVLEGSLDLVISADDQVVLTQAIPYRIYALMGPATFTSPESPHLAWVAAIDQALRGIGEVEPTDQAVLSALIEWVFRESELRYDTRSGASFYMSYGRGWDDGRFNFRGFLDRTNGAIVNCSDCSGIAGVFANMLGVGLDYSIILSNFSLNEIKAIGVDEYTSCPFGPYSCGFSYHAVTTNNLSESIWDATLALDGDDDPGSEPWEELLVQEISGEEYLQRLVRSGSAGYYYDDSRVRIQ